MHVMILGGGVIGVTSAWYLAKAGHQVTVIERLQGPAMETSAANAGQISPGYATPWAAPGIPLKAIKWMFQRHAPLAFRPDGSCFQLQWILAMLKNCNLTDYQINKERMVRLSEYSRDCLKELRRTTGINYQQRQGGTLQLFRTAEQFQQASRDIQVLKEAGVPYRLLESQQLPEVEPGLSASIEKLTGGLQLPNDETGDCQLFTLALAKLTLELGVEYRYNTEVERIVVEGNKIKGIRCKDTLLTADHYLLACGSWSTQLLKGIIPIPVYPMKGYSLTLPINNYDAAPVSTILDETYKIAITRFDDRIRVGGMAELVGFNKQLSPSRRATLEMVTEDLYPGSGRLAEGQFWCGLRPVTPDSTPIMGATPISNLFLNTGHGTLGWTMACGSAQLIADIMSGTRPQIAASDLSVLRYLHK